MDQCAEITAEESKTQSGAQLSARLHPHCVVCSADNPCGLCLHFEAGDDDTVTAEFELDQSVEGYTGWPHGGITSAILDGAMTNWLFAHGLTGVTAELNVCFRHPVRLNEPTRVTARLQRASHPLYILEALITQDCQLKVRAVGWFLHKPSDTERP